MAMILERFQGDLATQGRYSLPWDRDVRSRSDIETLHARALWFFPNDPVRFHQAEHAAFFDNARRGRTWDGFQVSPGLAVNRDGAHLHALADKVQSFFRE